MLLNADLSLLSTLSARACPVTEDEWDSLLKRLEEMKVRTESLRRVIEKGRKLCEESDLTDDTGVDKEVKGLMREIFDSQTGQALARGSEEAAGMAQQELLKVIEKRVTAKNEDKRTVEEDELVMKEMEKICEEREISERMRELCSERRVEWIKKRKFEDFCKWKKQAKMEIKRLKAEEKRFSIDRRRKLDESLGESEEDDDEDVESDQEMAEAVKWAMENEKRKGDRG